MNKNAIKKFAIEARKKLIDSVTDKAGMIGITEKSCSEPITKRADFEVYQTVAGTEVTLNKRQCEQRRRLVAQIESRGFEAVVEEVAYTWFNRICAIRFMEVNDYLPNRVRVLSSEKEEKMEPDLVTQAPDVDLDLTAQEKEEIINWKMSGTSEDTDKMFGKLFLKQCHQLHDILPGLFEADSDYMELLFGISYTNKDDVIYMLVNPETGIPEADFNVSTLDEEGNPTGQVEIIGWLYQYYNTELKDDTFAKLKKNVKITKERIPAATQLFTPDWIVRYMVENSVGRIWIEHLRAVDPTTDEKTTAERFGWKYYLPEAEQEEEVNIKLAEIRTTYKDLKPTDITCIDPCMGSGHILIAMFDVLMDIYESAGYDKREAAFEIVKHNIHGLDIDQRAYQLAYFAVMMKGRGYNRRFLRGRDGKPEPKIYVIVENNEINRNHLQFFGTHLSEQERNLAVIQIEGLLDTFKDAREYGSILNVDVCEWDALERFVDDLCTTGQISFESVGSEETQESLHKLVRVAKNLGQKYDAIVTNPPYMGASGMGAKLSKYVKDNYPDSKSDLFAVFIEKCGEMAKKNGYQAMITQHAWMFLSSFEKLRNKLQVMDIVNMAHLGPRAFEEIGGEVVQTTSFVIRKSHIKGYKGTYCRLIEPMTQRGKERMFLNVENRYFSEQDNFSKIPGRPVAYWFSNNVIELFLNLSLGKIGRIAQGLITGSTERFTRLWFEISRNRFIRSFVSYAVGCMFGRYSLKKEGLVYAGGDFEKCYKKEKEVLADVDGNIIIMLDGAALITGEHYGKIKTDNGWVELTYSPDLDNCIPITDEEYFSDDIVGRFVEFVKTVYGAATLEENLDFIANALGNKGDTSREVIRNYFLKDFYTDHLKVYQKRPIYWLFDSGKQNGFKALIYMHRYDADTVGRVRTDYLHRAQKYVETAMQSAQYTIDNASSASEKSKATKSITKYTKQLAEMKIYDEAIAHIANKRIEINLDDGVKVNYAKFQKVEVAQEGKKALKVDLLAKI